MQTTLNFQNPEPCRNASAIFSSHSLGTSRIPFKQRFFYPNREQEEKGNSYANLCSEGFSLHLFESIKGTLQH